MTNIYLDNLDPVIQKQVSKCVCNITETLYNQHASVTMGQRSFFFLIITYAIFTYATLKKQESTLVDFLMTVSINIAMMCISISLAFMTNSYLYLIPITIISILFPVLFVKTGYRYGDWIWKQISTKR